MIPENPSPLKNRNAIDHTPLTDGEIGGVILDSDMGTLTDGKMGYY